MSSIEPQQLPRSVVSAFPAVGIDPEHAKMTGNFAGGAQNFEFGDADIFGMNFDICLVKLLIS